MSYRQLLRTSWDQRRGALRSDSRIAASPALTQPREAGGAARRRTPPPRRLRRQLFERFLQTLENERGGTVPDREETRARVHGLLEESLHGQSHLELSGREKIRLEEDVVSEICGLGPLDRLFADPSVSDILVNGPEEIWVDRYGRLARTSARFDDDAHLMRLLGRLVASHGRHLDEASPSVDVRLPDGSRLHAVIPPLTSSPTVSIRRARQVPLRLEELCSYGTLTPEAGELLAAAVRARLNIVVSGGAASGKTTLLNVLSAFIPAEERVVTIEETAELDLDHPHAIALEARLPNVEGRGEFTLRDLVRNALRMRPDRILVGEVRGPEVFDMLQAMNTGHEGSLTTVHANSPQDALRRLESLVLLAGLELPSAAIRELLGATLNLIVHTDRFADGTRRVTSIGEVASGDGRLASRELLRFRSTGTAQRQSSGRHEWTANQPLCLDRLIAAGLRPERLGAATADAAEEIA